MTKLSWRDGVLAGFRLVARRPTAALSWALMFVVSGTLMAGFQVWAWQRLQAEGGLSQVAMRLSLGGLVLNVFVTVVTCAAILRATIRPDDRHAAWPRLGGDEMRLLAFAPPLALAWIVIAAPIGMLFYQLLPGQSVLPTNLAMCLAVGVLTLVGARLALAAPMTVAEQRLRLGGALDLSRGLHLRLAAILVSALLLSLAVEWAGSSVRDALAGARAPLLRAPSQTAAMASAFGASAMAARIFGALVHALALTVQIAPIGYACHRLTDDPADQAAVFD